MSNFFKQHRKKKKESAKQLEQIKNTGSTISIPKANNRGTREVEYTVYNKETRQHEKKTFKMTKSMEREYKSRIQARNYQAEQIIKEMNELLHDRMISQEEHQKFLQNVRKKSLSLKSIFGAEDPAEKFKKQMAGLGQFKKDISDIKRRKNFERDGRLNLIEAFNYNFKKGMQKAINEAGSSFNSEDNFNKEMLLSYINHPSVTTFDLVALSSVNNDLKIYEFYEDTDRQSEAIENWKYAIEERLQEKGELDEIQSKIYKQVSNKIQKESKRK